MAEVLVTGAAGLIGGILRQRLDGHAVAGVDVRRVRGSGIRRVDMRRLRSVEAAFEGAEVIVDLAAHRAVATPWRDVHRDNLTATMNALEAARRRGVRRVVFASSCHVTGLYERDSPYREIAAGSYDGLDPSAIPLIGSSSPIRPDGAYAIGKVLGEAAARYYSETSDLSVICLRIGTVKPEDRPTRPRDFATLLSHADLARLVECAIRAPDDRRFGVYYGVSGNRWRFWDIAEACEAIGYVPQDDAETFRP